MTCANKCANNKLVKLKKTLVIHNLTNCLLMVCVNYS